MKTIIKVGMKDKDGWKKTETKTYNATTQTFALDLAIALEDILPRVELILAETVLSHANSDGFEHLTQKELQKIFGKMVDAAREVVAYFDRVDAENKVKVDPL